MSMPAFASAAMTASLMGSVCVRVKSSVSPVGALSTVSRLSAGLRVIAQVKGFAVLGIKFERLELTNSRQSGSTYIVSIDLNTKGH